MMKVSIIIPCYNAEKTVKECLNSVLNQNCQDFEVLVADDNSQDNTFEILKKYKNVKLFKNLTNLGSGASRNRLIKESKGEILLFLDSDCVVNRDCISSHLKWHEKEHDIVGGSIKGIYSTIWGKVDNYCSWFTSIPNSRNRFIQKIHLPTTNLSIRRNTFEDVGYFREDVKTGEDADWCHRAEMKRYKLFFAPDIKIKHYNRNRLKDLLKHETHWGMHAVQIRSQSNMSCSWIIPQNIYTASALALPIALGFTLLLIKKWFHYDRKILFYFLFILIAKIAYSFGIISACYNKKKWKW